MQAFVRRAPILLVAVTLGALGVRAVLAEEDTWSSAPAQPGGEIVLKTVMVEDLDEDPVAAGKAAAQALLKIMVLFCFFQYFLQKLDCLRNQAIRYAFELAP